MSGVRERVTQFIKAKHMTTVDFEKSIGVSNGYISSISKSIQPDKLDIISDKYPDLSIEWLLIGKGDMIKKEQPTTLNTQSGQNINATYHGSFTEPINTMIGDNNIFGGNAAKNDAKKNDDLKLKKIYTDFDADIQKYQMENDYLKHRVESLESQLAQAIADKERAMNMLDKLINKAPL